MIYILCLLCALSIALNVFFVAFMLDVKVKRIHHNRKQTLKFAKTFKIK